MKSRSSFIMDNQQMPAQVVLISEKILLRLRASNNLLLSI